MNTILKQIAIAVVLLSGIVVPVSSVQAKEGGVWNQAMPREWYLGLARCETGNNTKHSTRSYVGAFGFYRRTWDLFADTPNRRAPRLTFNQQARVLDRAFWYGHTERGRKQWPVGPWGHGCFKMSKSAQQAVCTHRKHQVRRWCR
jgi:hypothetical protein